MAQDARHIDQAVFPGQAAAPEGPIDGIGMYVMHHAFRRDLARFAAAAARTPLTDRRSWRALGRRWRRFATTLHHHHTAEDDGIWPELLRRTRAAGDEQGTATLVAMESEHQGLDRSLAACAAGFGRMARTPDTGVRATLTADITALRAALDRHLGHEERSAMAVIQRYLDAEDWERLEKQVLSKAYPATAMIDLLPWIMDDVPEHLRRRILHSGGGVLRVLVAVLRIPYERTCRPAYRYATGPTSVGGPSAG